MASIAIPLPDLHSGDRLSVAEFLRRWEQIPDLKRAELIDGVVYVASPVSELHSVYEQLLNRWLSHYEAYTKGLAILPNPTVLLGRSAPQPDLALLRESGSSRSGKKYREGPPELIVEISYSTASYDLSTKLDLYRRAGVREYINILLEQHKAQWRVLEGDRYHLLRPSAGYLKSREFPGLWLDPSALFPPKIKQMLAAVDAGRSAAA